MGTGGGIPIDGFQSTFIEPSFHQDQTMICYQGTCITYTNSCAVV